MKHVVLVLLLACSIFAVHASAPEQQAAAAAAASSTQPIAKTHSRVASRIHFTLKEPLDIKSLAQLALADKGTDTETLASLVDNSQSAAIDTSRRPAFQVAASSENPVGAPTLSPRTSPKAAAAQAKSDESDMFEGLTVAVDKK